MGSNSEWEQNSYSTPWNKTENLIQSDQVSGFKDDVFKYQDTVETPKYYNRLFD